MDIICNKVDLRKLHSVLSFFSWGEYGISGYVDVDRVHQETTDRAGKEIYTEKHGKCNQNHSLCF